MRFPVGRHFAKVKPPSDTAVYKAANAWGKIWGAQKAGKCNFSFLDSHVETDTVYSIKSRKEAGDLYYGDPP